MTDPDRYDGKPFLKLLDCYVLSAIDCLDDEQKAVLQSLEPNLQETYNFKGGWLDIVSQQMEFPENLPTEIMGIWKEGRKKASEMGFEPDPLEFTYQLVDTNFA